MSMRQHPIFDAWLSESQHAIRANEQLCQEAAKYLDGSGPPPNRSLIQEAAEAHRRASELLRMALAELQAIADEARFERAQSSRCSSGSSGSDPAV
jgi:hypothetical protein